MGQPLIKEDRNQKFACPMCSANRMLGGVREEHLSKTPGRQMGGEGSQQNAGEQACRDGATSLKRTKGRKKCP
jgi:hypothetical protein